VKTIMVRMVDIVDIDRVPAGAAIVHCIIDLKEYHGCTYYSDLRTDKRLHLCKMSDWNYATELAEELIKEIL